MAKEASVALKGLQGKFKRSFKKFRDQDVKKKSGGGLPPDLKRQTCQPTKYSISVSAQGDEYVSLTCVAVTPEELKGVPGTQFWYFNDSDWSTADDNLEVFVNDLKLMGCDLSDVEELFAPGVLEAILDDLIERKPYLLYHTYKTKKGAVRFEVDDVNDKFEAIEEEPQVEGESEEEEAPARTRSNASSRGAAKTSRGRTTAPEPEPEEIEEEAEVEEETADMPEIGQVWGYKETPKGVVEACKITKLNAKDRTCTLKRLRDKKVFNDVDVDTDLITMDDDE